MDLREEIVYGFFIVIFFEIRAKKSPDYSGLLITLL